jgi:hypothetical protein
MDSVFFDQLADEFPAIQNLLFVHGVNLDREVAKCA